MMRHVNDLVGVGIYLVEWYILWKRIHWSEIEVYCEVGFEQHICSGLLK